MMSVVNLSPPSAPPLVRHKPDVSFSLHNTHNPNLSNFNPSLYLSLSLSGRNGFCLYAQNKVKDSAFSGVEMEESENIVDDEYEFDDDEDYEFDDDDVDVDVDDDDELLVPLENLNDWLERKPRGFGEGKVYDTTLEDKLLEEIEQSFKAQVSNVEKLKREVIKSTSKTQVQGLFSGKRDCRHRSVIHLEDMSPTRRQFCSVTSMMAILNLNQGLVKAESKAEEKQEDVEGVIGTIKSLFDPNEKTKSGKVLPKAYLKSAREVLKTLRESLREDPKNIAKFRRTADAAKESIRDYLNNWRGKQDVAQEESYMELEKVIRTLANFYAKAGPSASISDEVKTQILQDLDTTEQFL